MQQLAAVGLHGDSNRNRRVEIASRIRMAHVAPLEYRRYHRRDPEEPSHITSAEGSAVPRLRKELERIGSMWARSVTSRLLEAVAQVTEHHSKKSDELQRALWLASIATCEDR
jgi:hypothetical protein